MKEHMRIPSLLLAVLLSCSAQAALRTEAPDNEHPSIKRPYNLPPSADLNYSIKAKQHGLNISGEATVAWRHSGSDYSIDTESRVALFGKILENRSEGAVDDYGMAPASFYEKRIRKDPATTRFQRDSKTITFS